MSGRYLYCQNPECGEYLGSLGGNECHICGWKVEEEEDAEEGFGDDDGISHQ